MSLLQGFKLAQDSSFYNNFIPSGFINRKNYQPLIFLWTPKVWYYCNKLEA